MAGGCHHGGNYIPWLAINTSILVYRTTTPLRIVFPAIIGAVRRVPAWRIKCGMCISVGRGYQKGMQHGSYMVWPVSGPELDQDFTRNRISVEGEFIRDDESGNMWHIRVVPNNAVMSWDEAIQQVAELNRNEMLGYNDWRLPNIRELEDLVDLNRHSPALPTGFDFHDGTGGLWSSTTSMYDAAYAWVLYPRDGAVGVGYKREAIFNVWATRG